MKFVRYAGLEGERLGLLSRDGAGVLDIAKVAGVPSYPTMVALIEGMTPAVLDALRQAADDPAAGWLELSGARLLAPIERPAHDILCVGVNYMAHRAETGHTFDTEDGQPPQTVYFSKRAARLLGPGEAIRGRFDLDTQLDYEVELAVIIGKRGIDIPREEAEAHIFGYAVFNDISSRRLQKAHMQWFKGKSLDGYAALGPCILHRDSLPMPFDAEVISRVNGEVRQHAHTGQFIADIPTVIAELSAGMALEPGDIIATGTPSGVGLGFDPPRFLRRGDTVACEIPLIGTLENPVS